MNNIQKKIYRKYLFGKLALAHGASLLISYSLIQSAPRKNWIKKQVKNFHTIFLRFSAGKLSTKEQTLFAKRLSFLIKANVPLLESLSMLREQTTSRSYAQVLDVVINDVSNGQFLSKSLSKFKNTFGDFAINIIKVGESSGILSENLEYLADELKKKQMLRKKVISAFVYPAVIVLATIGITVFLMVYLFPKIMPIFNSLNMHLPITTRIVIAVSNFLRQDGFLFFLGIVVFVFISIFIIKTFGIVRFYFDRGVLRLPVIGKMIKYYNLANGTRTLGLLLKSGMTLTEALPITALTTKNLVYKREFIILGRAVGRGEKISTHLKKNPGAFPDVLPQMVAVGERSGNLSNTLVYLSELYDNEVDDLAKNLSSLIEPILMVFMGILVGFIAVSIITPIYGITQNLHG